jgi:DNA-directed RNA polymerase II subunit RPB1
MEDVLVAYDRTVRGYGGEIIQFVYGEDGMAGEYIEDIYLSLMQMDYKAMERMYKHDFTQEDYGQNWITNPAIRNEIRLSFQHQNVLEQEWQNLLVAKERLCSDISTNGEPKHYLPINVSRLIELAQQRFVNEVSHFFLRFY